MSMIRAAMIGCGSMARHHLEAIVKQPAGEQFVALCDPNAEALTLATSLFQHANLPIPQTFTTLEALLSADLALDVVFIISPHAFHHDQTAACMQAGLDVLLEKPMVMNAHEAQSLIRVRDETQRLLVVAFQGSLSPEVRTAVTMLRSGELGDILTIHAVAYQGWKEMTTGTWRQNPAISGGGFMFDTGAHLMNTVADLAGEPFEDVAAWFDNRGAPVDILTAAMGRLASGALVTLSACGDTVPGAYSDVQVMCTQGVLQTGIWGRVLRVQRPGSEQFETVPCPPVLGSWDQFLKVRAGELTNPSPPEVGLRMALLWDALQASAAQGGQPVRC